MQDKNYNLNHIAFIMDGNRRYGKKYNLTKKEAYKKGLLQLANMVKLQVKYGIYETSFFALSKDNYEKRPLEEKKIIYDLIEDFSNNKVEELGDFESFIIKNKIKIYLKGDINYIKEKEKKSPKNFKLNIEEIEKRYNNLNNKIGKENFKVNICLNYDGQEEILHSFKNIYKLISENKLKLEDVTTETIKKNIYFNNSEPPEIIVRTGNAPRISGFLLWDSKYSEFYFTSKFWPELTEEDFENMLIWFSSIQRNFGK